MFQLKEQRRTYKPATQTFDTSHKEGIREHTSSGKGENKKFGKKRRGARKHSSPHARREWRKGNGKKKETKIKGGSKLRRPAYAHFSGGCEGGRAKVRSGRNQRNKPCQSPREEKYE